MIFGMLRILFHVRLHRHFINSHIEASAVNNAAVYTKQCSRFSRWLDSTANIHFFLWIVLIRRQLKDLRLYWNTNEQNEYMRCFGEEDKTWFFTKTKCKCMMVSLTAQCWTISRVYITDRQTGNSPLNNFLKPWNVFTWIWLEWRVMSIYNS